MKGFIPAGVVILVFGLAACEQDSPTSPAAPQFAEGHPEIAVHERVTLCKVGPNAPFDFTIDPGDATNLPEGLTPTLTPDAVTGYECVLIAIKGDDATTVTVTETVPDGFLLDSIVVDQRESVGGTITTTKVAGPSASVMVGGTVGGLFTFYNSAEVTTGAEGCTPGFWKNRALTVGAWDDTPYTTGQTLSSVFTVPGALSTLGATSLYDALSLPGGSGVQGGARILFRAAVAALLNASHPSVDYAYDAATVISMVDAALAQGGDTEKQWRQRMIDLAGDLDGANNGGCPLGSPSN